MIAPVYSLTKFYESVYFPARHVNSPRSTTGTYRSSIAIFERFWLEQDPHTNCDIKHVCVELVDQFKVWRAAQEITASTINRDLRAIRALLNLARKRGHRPRKRKYRCQIDFLREYVEDPVAWSIEDLGKILTACGQIAGPIRSTRHTRLLGKVPESLLITVVVLLIINTNSRIGAIMMLRPQDYNPASGILLRRGNTQKNRESQSDQLISLVRFFLDKLCAIADPQRERLIPFPFAVEAMRDRYKKVIEIAELKCTRRDLFHKLRKTMTTLVAIEQGMEAAQKLCGHSSERVTKKHYVDPMMVPGTDLTHVINWSKILAPLISKGVQNDPTRKPIKKPGARKPSPKNAA